MKAVILAAGRGSRLKPLTDTTPKALLKIDGLTLIEHNLELIYPFVDSYIVVVNYLGEQIIEYIGDNYKEKKIEYIRQKELLGTGDALFSCAHLLRDDEFIVLMSDDLYQRKDIESLLPYKFSLLSKEAQSSFVGGEIEVDDKDRLVSIVEGEHQKGDLVNVGVYKMSPEIFDYSLVKIPGRDEYGLPQTLVAILHKHEIIIKKANFWMQINDVKGLENAKEYIEKQNEKK